MKMILMTINILNELSMVGVNMLPTMEEVSIMPISK